MYSFLSRTTCREPVYCDLTRYGDLVECDETYHPFSPRLDFRDLAPGADWDRTVADRIGSSGAFVFVVGPEETRDRWQHFEWQQVIQHEYYLDPNLPLIPVLLGKPELPGFLKTRKSLPLQGTASSCRKVAREIANALQDAKSSIDERKLNLARKARRNALKTFEKYSLSLERADIKQAGIRAIK